MSPEIALCLYLATFAASALMWLLGRFGVKGWAS